VVVALKNEVVDLRRVRVLGIRLGRLAPGEYRAIEGAEREEFLKTLGL
jgi:16S rRNA U516 pseudouridylate synthase RsuA-like enzyme